MWGGVAQTHTDAHTHVLEERGDVIVVQLQVLLVLLGIGLQWDHGLAQSVGDGGPQLLHQGLVKPH